MDTKVERLLDEKGNNYIFPFLWMHGEDESTLRAYVRVIINASIKEFCVESRPHPDFCGEQWWRDMDIVLDEAQKHGMRVWILDDSHFPTSYANGALKNCNSELCRQSIVCRVLKCPESGKVGKWVQEEFAYSPAWQPNLFEQYSLPQEHLRGFDDDDILCIQAVRAGGESLSDIIEIPVPKNGELCVAVPQGEWNIHVLYSTRNYGPHRDYINMTSARSCKLLLDAVYEPHYTRYAKLFGKTIAGFFSDEPELGNGHLYEYGKRLYEMNDQTWSDEICKALKEKWGKDFGKYLPLLWEQNFDKKLCAKTRCDYMDAVTRLVQSAFSEQIGNWCREHNVQYVGHLIEDNNQHTRTGSGLGHFFRGQAGQDMAGIDDIGGQVLPQGEWSGPYGITGEERNGLFYQYVLGKLGTSAAAIDTRKNGRAFCETPNRSGWENIPRPKKLRNRSSTIKSILILCPPTCLATANIIPSAVKNCV